MEYLLPLLISSVLMVSRNGDAMDSPKGDSIAWSLILLQSVVSHDPIKRSYLVLAGEGQWCLCLIPYNQCDYICIRRHLDWGMSIAT